jgi:hypothetical protein
MAAEFSIRDARSKPAARVEVNKVTEDLPEPQLLDAGAAALDEDHQHDHEQDACDNPDKGCIVHFSFPFLSTLECQLPRCHPGNENGLRRSGAVLISWKLLSRR